MAEKLAYMSVRDYLRKRIFSGEFKPGDILPSENALCSKFGVSRETARKGIKALETEGLIYSREKVGYFVSAPNHEDLSLTFTEDRDNHTTQFVSVHGIRPPEFIRSILDTDSRMVIEMSQLTTDADGVPAAYDIKYLAYERSRPSVESEMRFTLKDMENITEAAPFDYYTEIEVSAVGAPAKIAAVLKCPENTPLLLIEKTFIRQDGKKVCYSMQYSLKNFGRLHGKSGPQK